MCQGCHGSWKRQAAKVRAPTPTAHLQGAIRPAQQRHHLGVDATHNVKVVGGSVGQRLELKAQAVLTHEMRQRAPCDVPRCRLVQIEDSIHVVGIPRVDIVDIKVQLGAIQVNREKVDRRPGAVEKYAHDVAPEREVADLPLWKRSSRASHQGVDYKGDKERKKSMCCEDVQLNGNTIMTNISNLRHHQNRHAAGQQQPCEAPSPRPWWC